MSQSPTSRSFCQWPLRAVLLACALSSACGLARPDSFFDHCPEFTPDIQPALQPCVGCHSGTSPAAGYRLDDYFAVTARRPDGSARVVPGDASSAFLAAVRGELPAHQALSEDSQTLTSDWVVRCQASPRRHRFHPLGWMTPTAPTDFHGKTLKASGYDVAPCQKCHGDDLKGGKANVNCYSCHKLGPFACNVCHGDSSANPDDLRNVAPPKDLKGATATSSPGVGAHQKHLNDGPLHKAFACEACHVVPKNAEDLGHYRIDAGTGEVTLKPTPADVIVRGSPNKAPVWNADNATCGSVYCHDPLGAPDTKAKNSSPTWNSQDAGEAACGTCHGLPPSTHADNRCEICHGIAFVADAGIVVAMHVNGTIDLGDGKGPTCATCQCQACHGDTNTPAPPRDTHGNTDPGLKSIGAHRAHLNGPHQLRGPVPCNECHRVPTTVDSPGHLDHLPPAETFPAVAGVSAIARKDGALPVYDPASATCSNVYCHGGGTKFARDTTPGLKRTPSWLGGPEAIVCGTCHGIPPNDADHPAGTINLANCYTCHNATIAPTGEFRITTDADGGISTTHMNGIIEDGGP